MIVSLLKIDHPRDSDTHTLADFAEILCIYQLDEVCSRDLISDQINDSGHSRPIDAKLEDCFTQLKWRASAFGKAYPFRLDANSRLLTFVGNNNLTAIQKIYVSLLYCSNLPLITIRNKNPITDFFEVLALNALGQSWPVAGQVKVFAKSQSDYTGQKWQRLNQLAINIGGIGLCSDNTFRQGDSGDGGIDLVGWVYLDDYEKRNIASLLAQCACSRDDWSRKQNEISRSRLGNMIHASHPWAEIIFTPICFRDNHGKWYTEGAVGQTIIYDRLRILKLLRRAFFKTNVSIPYELDQLLQEKAELV